MGLFDDVSRFLETRLEEFLRDHPHLELQALMEQLNEQARDTQRLILELQQQEKQLQNQILALAEDIQTWHGRIAKAKAARRDDLAQAAQAREAALLRQGNQLWGQMEGAKKRIVQAQNLLQQIQTRRLELEKEIKRVEQTAKAAAQSKSWETQAWQDSRSWTSASRNDDLEAKFQQLELETELNELKRNLRT